MIPPRRLAIALALLGLALATPYLVPMGILASLYAQDRTGSFVILLDNLSDASVTLSGLSIPGAVIERGPQPGEALRIPPAEGGRAGHALIQGRREAGMAEASFQLHHAAIGEAVPVRLPLDIRRHRQCMGALRLGAAGFALKPCDENWPEDVPRRVETLTSRE